MKWLFRSAFAIVLLFSLFIFSLPALLSTNPGKRALLYLINQNERKITFSSLSLSWLGPQVIEGLCIEDASSGLFLSVRKIHLSTNLFSLCLKKKNVNELVISEPCLALHAVQNENKTEELSFVRSTSKSSSLPHQRKSAHRKRSSFCNSFQWRKDPISRSFRPSLPSLVLPSPRALSLLPNLSTQSLGKPQPHCTLKSG